MFKPVKTYSKSTSISFPGSESIQFDMEKLFLLSVSKENLGFRRKIKKNLTYKILNLPFFGKFWGRFGEVFGKLDGPKEHYKRCREDVVRSTRAKMFPGDDFGYHFGPREIPKRVPRGSQEGPKRVPRGTKRCPRRAQKVRNWLQGFSRVLGLFSDYFGTFLVLFRDPFRLGKSMRKKLSKRSFDVQN